MSKLKSLLLFALCLPIYAQALQDTLRVTRLYNLSSDQVIDNRSRTLRSNSYHTFSCVGSGTWTCQIQYSDTSSSGPWTNYENSGSSTDNSSLTGFGIGVNYHPYIRITTTGTVTSISYTGMKDVYFASTSSGGGGDVSSVFGRTGAVVFQTGDATTTQVTEGSNLYFTASRAQAAMAGLYAPPTSGTGVLAGNGSGGFNTATASDITTTLMYIPENVTNKSTSTSLGTSNTLYPSQNAVKSYVDTAVAAVTASSLGLGNVNNTSDANKPISTATQAALDLKEPANSNIQSHISNTSNPHSVTKTQVGLGSVDNTSDLGKPISTAQATVNSQKMDKASNLSDVASASTSRANLGMTNYVDPDSGANDPSGACTPLKAYLQTTLQEMWDCTSSGTWKRRLSTEAGQTLLITGSCDSAPGTQGVGSQAIWMDCVAGVPQSENENGEIGTMTKIKAARTANTFITYVDVNGIQNTSVIQAGDLPIASASSVGGVKCGSGTACAADGTISASATAGVNTVGAGTGDSGVAGDVKLVAGTGMSVSRSGQNITLTNTGGGGGGGSSHIIPFQVDGGGSVLTTGDIKVYIPVPYACTITGGTVTAGNSGSITVDVWKAAGAIPTASDKISATAPMALAASQFNSSIDLTGWTTSVSSGDVLAFYIASVSSVTSVRGQLFCDTASTASHVINISLDGGGSAITTGATNVYIPVNYACTITGGAITSDQSGSIAIDVWKAAGAIPTSGDKISASAPLSLSSAQYNGSPSLTGWTTSVSIGDVISFSVASASTVTRVTGQLYCQ